MPFLKILTAIDYPGLGGASASLGDSGEPTSVEIAGEPKHIQENTVASEATKKLYDSSEDIATFAVMILLSDVSGVILEIVTDLAAAFGTRTAYVTLVAGVPFILTQQSLANNANGFAGTAALVDKVTALNGNADETDATVTVLAFL